MKILSRHSLWLALLLSCRLICCAIADPLADGDAALQKFDLDAALSAYRIAHSNAPTNYEVTWKLARALADKSTLTKNRGEQKKLCVEAEKFARDAVRLSPNDAKGHAVLAIAVGKRALFEGGKRKVELSKEIKIEAEKAIALNPKEDLAYHVLGIWYREMVELNWALKKFAEFCYGSFPPASIDQSIHNLRTASRLEPKAVAHHVELGLTLIAAGKRDEANTEFGKALELPRGWVTDDYYVELAKRNYRRTTKT